MTEYIIGLIIGAATCLVCYWMGWSRGRTYGRDEQWVENVLANARRNRERRDAYGRFRSVGGRN